MLRGMGSKAEKPKDPPPPAPVPKTADAYQAGAEAMVAERKNSSYLDSFLTGKRKALGGGTSFLGGGS